MKALTGRLAALYNEIPDNIETLADIGCDHGKIIVAAAISGKCKKGIGIDISSKSLSKAVSHAKNAGVANLIDFYNSDGFSVIDEKLSCVIIAGLGGIEICNILSQKHFANLYILSPHQDAYLLRRYMINNNLKAIKDYVIYDKNKYYTIIVAKKDKCDYSETEMYLGKNFPQNDNYALRNKYRLEYINTLIRNTGNHSDISFELLKEREALLLWQKSKT